MADGLINNKVPEFITILRWIRDVAYPAIIGYMFSTATTNIVALKTEKETVSLEQTMNTSDYVTAIESTTKIRYGKYIAIVTTPDGSAVGRILYNEETVNIEATLQPYITIRKSLTTEDIELGYVGIVSGIVEATIFSEQIKEA